VDIVQIVHLVHVVHFVHPMAEAGARSGVLVG
jgi:hypothetical protein